MLIENLSINITPNGVPLIIHISQYDVGLRTFIFTPYTSSGTFTPDTAVSATLEGTKPDGNIVIHNCEYDSATGQITYTIQEQLAAVAGRVWSKIVLRDTDGNAIGYTAIVWLVDMAGVADGAVASDSDISALAEFIKEFGTINAYKSALDGAIAAVGGPNVASTVAQMTDRTKVYVYTGSQSGYTAGHWYYWNGSAWTDGGVYQATAVETDKTLAVTDMAADAKATGDAVTELKNDLGNNFGLVDITGFVPKKYINTNVSVGATVDLTEQSSNGYSYKIVECSAGDTILVNGQGGASPRLWAFLDASYKLISKSASALTGSNLIITAPANTSYCIINSETSALGECCFTPNWHGVTNAIVSNSHLIRSTAIPSGADLNDYTTPGNYYVSTTAIATSLQNRPSNSSGRLTVMTLNSNSNIFQTYTNVKAEVFTREKDSNGWSDWTKNVVDADLSTVNTEIDALKGALISNQYNVLSTAIPSGADLNDYTTPGNYYVSTTAIARSLVNAPMYIDGVLANSSGRLIVMSTMSASSLLQVYINAKGEIFTRQRGAVYWSYWEKKASEADTGVYATRGAYNAMQALIAQSDYNIAFANSFVPLGLKNYLGNTQNVHPKVLYFESGFGGHTYWMCYTPYPYSDDINENPCVAYSDDGYTWKNISGNPLDTAEAPNYNSDGHLVYRSDTGVLELWYRYFERDTEIKTMYRITSTDGVTWSQRELIKTFTASEDCASQAVIFDGTNYLIWGVSAGTTIDFYTAPANDVTSWTKVRTLNTAYYDRNTRVYPWHIDVIIDENTYVILAMCRNTRNVSDGVWSLFITTSSDNITYSTPVKVVGGVDSWDKYMYRSTIVKVGGKYRIYYSACSTKSTTSIYNNAYWGMGITESDELTTGYIGKFE